MQVIYVRHGSAAVVAFCQNHVVKKKSDNISGAIEFRLFFLCLCLLFNSKSRQTSFIVLCLTWFPMLNQSSITHSFNKWISYALFLSSRVSENGNMFAVIIL